MFEQFIKVHHTCIIYEIQKNINLLFYLPRAIQLSQITLVGGVFLLGCFSGFLCIEALTIPDNALRKPKTEWLCHRPDVIVKSTIKFIPSNVARFGNLTSKGG